MRRMTSIIVGALCLGTVFCSKALPRASAEEPILSQSGDVLDRRVRSFRVQDAPLADLMYALNCVGVRVCWEVIEPEDITYVDHDGNLAFHGRTCSLAACDISVRDLFDQIAKQAPDYQWEQIPGTDLINLFPKRGSQLSFRVAAFEGAGNVFEILARIPDGTKLSPARWRGPPPPRILVKFRGGTGRDLLNEIALQHGQGEVWRSLGNPATMRNSVTFSSVLSGDLRTTVDIVYDVTRGKPALDPPDFWAVSYHVDLSSGADPRVFVARKPVDLVAQRTSSLAEPNRTLVRRFVSIVRAILSEDTDAISEAVHPDGVRDGARSLSHADVVAGYKEAFKKRNYQQFKLADVLDLDKIEVTPRDGGKFRVSVKPKVKKVGDQLYFDDVLWFTFAKSEKGEWQIVEFD